MAAITRQALEEQNKQTPQIPAGPPRITVVAPNEIKQSQPTNIGDYTPDGYYRDLKTHELKKIPPRNKEFPGIEQVWRSDLEHKEWVYVLFPRHYDLYPEAFPPRPPDRAGMTTRWCSSRARWVREPKNSIVGKLLWSWIL